jgi:hypothetical protein
MRPMEVVPTPSTFYQDGVLLVWRKLKGENFKDYDFRRTKEKDLEKQRDECSTSTGLW